MELGTSKDGVQMGQQGDRELATQGRSMPAVVKDPRDDFVPTMQGSLYIILEREESTPGPPLMLGVVLPDPKKGCNLQEIKRRLCSPVLQGGAELLQLVIQEADTESVRIDGW